MIDQVLILAAGEGSRLNGGHAVPHKALIPLGGEPLLCRTCAILRQAGVRQAVVVLGYRGEAVRDALCAGGRMGLELEFVDNPLWRKANGVSILAAAACLQREYLLLMADHLFDPRMVGEVRRIEPEDGVVLAVDRKRDEVFDLDDATKVQIRGNRITAIGKGLPTYDAIDTGLFACSSVLVPALRQRLSPAGDVSLSEGMQVLAEAGKARCHDIGGAWWQDVDTPGALRHAERLLREHGTDPAWSEAPGPDQVSAILPRELSGD